MTSTPRSTVKGSVKARVSDAGIDVLCLSFIALVLLLTLIFHSTVPDWVDHSLKYIGAALLYGAGVWFADRIENEFLRTTLRTAAITLLFSFLFSAVHSLQHIFVPGWMDTEVIAFETQFTGVESTLFFQQHMSSIVTEVMMFAYVIYVPLLPFISLFCYWSMGRAASHDYLFNLSYAYIICYTGFMIFPVASPLYHQRELYTIPFEGGPFTWFGEWMRHNVHYAGGSLPSPHCAAATVMLVMMWRYNKKIFWPLLPVVLVLYVSTVYGRYHYMSDGVVGIIAGVFVLLTAPSVSRGLEKFHPRVLKRRQSTPAGNS